MPTNTNDAYDLLIGCHADDARDPAAWLQDCDRDEVLRRVALALDGNTTLHIIIETPDA